jgi:hypothetical protein
VWIGAADERGVDHPGQLEVVDVGRRAGDQPRVFLALDGGADVAAEDHGVVLHSSAWASERRDTPFALLGSNGRHCTGATERGRLTIISGC